MPPHARPTAAEGALSSEEAAAAAGEPEPTPFATSSSLGAAPGPDLLTVFGGCMDQSSFPYLARSYAQTAELWMGDLGGLT